MEQEKISAAIVSLLANAFDELYGRDYLYELFSKVMDTGNILYRGQTEIGIRKIFRYINQGERKPLDALGILLEEFMEEEIVTSSDFDRQERNDNQKNYRKRIKKALARENLFYQQRVGIIKKADVASILFLQGDVSKISFPFVINEIIRAKGNIKEKKYRDALLNSGSMLEAACKSYLKHKNIVFNSESSLYPLWEKTKVHFKNNTTHENIAEGLFVIIEGVRKERNQESTAHGRTEEETKQGRVYARSARLVVRSAITLSFYILDHLEI